MSGSFTLTTRSSHERCVPIMAVLIRLQLYLYTATPIASKQSKANCGENAMIIYCRLGVIAMLTNESSSSLRADDECVAVKSVLHFSIQAQYLSSLFTAFPFNGFVANAQAIIYNVVYVGTSICFTTLHFHCRAHIAIYKQL